MSLTLKLNKKILILLSFVLAIIIFLGIFLIFKEPAGAPAAPQTSNEAEKLEQTIQTKESPPNVAETPTQPPGFDKKKYSLEDPTSIWVVINKKRPLPSSYTPSDLTNVLGGLLRAEASGNLTNLVSSAKNSGYTLSIISSYRSFSTQQTTYNNYVAIDGQAKADTYSARPGYSEHQTGLATDLGNGACNLEICFGDSPAGKWLAVNSYKYGFIIRYPADKTTVTGYQYEPWHLRYVGSDLATEMQKTSTKTLEEFFSLTSAPGY